MKYYMGVDGGGTKTSCLVCNADGAIVGQGSAGPSNYHVVGVTRTREALRQCMEGSLLAAGSPQVEVCYLGLAGVDRPDDKELVGEMLQELNLPVARFVLDNDAAAAWAGATEARPGVIVVSGTGSIIFGVNGQGQRARAGGWGPILGDEGGGYDLGRLAMVAALKDEDGRGEKTVLKELITAHLSLTHISQLVSRVYVSNMERHEIAALCGLVFAAADRGDKVAEGLISQAAQELAGGVRAVANKLGLSSASFRLAPAGGVFAASPRLGTALIREVLLFAPLAEFIHPAFGPDVGAVILALKEGGLAITEATASKLRQSLRGIQGDV